jgi:lipopolysaccharide/colanic/teichoic acid biosynthesis glycosyltransferase
MIRQQFPLFDGTDRTDTRTVWGMDIAQLHEQFWASHGVQVVRSGDAARIDKNASLYLLLDSNLLVLFDLERTIDRGAWNRTDVVYARLTDQQEHLFRERVVTSDRGDFLRFERFYEGGPFSKTARVLVTRDPKLAAIWQVAPEPALAAKTLQFVVPRNRRMFSSGIAHLYDLHQASEEHFVTEVLKLWKDPQATIPGMREISGGVWAHSDAIVEPTVRLVGPVWVGAGQHLEGNAIVVGPLVLWDEAGQRPELPPIKMLSRPAPAIANEPTHPRPPRPYRVAKRLFDIAAALLGIAISLPIYPIIMMAIWLEDGRPFFFGHRRETLGGRKFLCLKFRSMRKDAEKVKLQLAAENAIDGPQFFMQQDPRRTRVGEFIRKRQLDELPQFFNVLLGHMSMVGPRPSPYSENQFCPPWREARLSVRPGITGLWQIMRTRRGDTDFQEWINYDLEYVRNMSLLYDLNILFRTVAMFVGRMTGKANH